MSDGALPYYSERHGRAPRGEPLAFEDLRRLAVSVFDSFRERAYFQEAFGYECVDGDQYGAVGRDPEAFFLRKIGREHIWPYWYSDPGVPALLRSTWAEEWDADTLFDVVEIFHDHVSEPTKGRHHSYGNCGYHATHFDQAAGRREYRAEINAVLDRHDPPYELGSNGRIIECVPDEFRPLLKAKVPAHDDEDLITPKIESAVRAFRARGAGIDDKRHAVRDLADVLETIRPEAKQAMQSKDEGALFDLANNFAIRHHTRTQKKEYDRQPWLSWAFYVYLATIHAVLRVRDREQ
jgi:hypothetical protein